MQPNRPETNSAEWQIVALVSTVPIGRSAPVAGRQNTVLRSGAKSQVRRWAGYSFAIVAVVTYGYTFFVAIWMGFWVDSVGGAAWIVGMALLILAFVVAATRYVIQRPYTGGYFIFALACLLAALASLICFAPFIIYA